MNNPLTDSPGLFASGDGGHPHCVIGGNDGLVYVCDRADDRIQVFTKTGELQRIIPVVPGTGVTLGIGGAPGLGTAGSAWDLAFSNDAMQTFMFEADGGNEILHIMDRVTGHDPRRVWLSRDSRPASSRSCTASRRLEGQPLHRRDDQRPAHPEVHARRVQQRQRQGRRQRQLRRLSRVRPARASGCRLVSRYPRHPASLPVTRVRLSCSRLDRP